MPKITQLFEVDGKMCVVLDMPTTDEGSVSILTSEEIEAIRQAEREECARIAESIGDEQDDESQARCVAYKIASDIRAKSDYHN